MERLLRKVPAPEEVPPGLEAMARSAALDPPRPPDVAAAPARQRAPTTSRTRRCIAAYSTFWCRSMTQAGSGLTPRPEVLEGFAETFAPAGFKPRALAPAYGLAEATLLAASVTAGQGFVVSSVDGGALAEGRVSSPEGSD